MLFSVDQEGYFTWRLVLEYGKVLGKSRRRTLLGKLLILPGIWILITGLGFLLGMVLVLWEGTMTAEEAPGMIVMVPLTLILVLWGLSWSGVNRFPAALTRLLLGGCPEEQTRFYPNHIEDTSGDFDMDCSYKGVQGVYESKTAFFLQLTSGQFLILRKDCFTSGVPDAFRRFIDERGGKPVIII